MNRSSSSLLSIQTLRGFAALYVMVFHSELALAHADVPALAWLTSHVIKRGHAGVDVFFVISSFIITWVAVLGPEGPEPANEFLVKQASRLVPPYWLMLMLYSTWFNPVPADVLLTSLAFVPQVSVGASYFGYPPLYVDWSLNYEIFFYALCTVGLTFFDRCALGLVVLALFTTTIVVPFWHSGVMQGNPEASYHWALPLQTMAANPLMLEFLPSAGLTWLYAAHQHRLAPAVTRILMTIGVATFVIPVAGPVPKFDLLARGLPADALLFGMVAIEHCGESRMPRVAVWLGELSYAFYLAHLAAVETAYRVVGRLAPEWIGTQLMVLAVNLAFTLALAVLVRRYVELPSIALGHRTARWIRSHRHTWRIRLGPQKP